MPCMLSCAGIRPLGAAGAAWSGAIAPLFGAAVWPGIVSFCATTKSAIWIGF